MAKFNIPKQSIPTITEAYSELIIGNKNQTIIQLPTTSLKEIDNQPFPLNQDKVEQIADSIRTVGLLEPIIVKQNSTGYDILAGRHRYRACKQLGYETVSCVITNLDEDNSRLVLLTTNIDRNNEYPPTVYARAFAEQVEILSKLGKGNRMLAEIAERQGTSRKTVQRYLRLNNLTDEWKTAVDDRSINLVVGVQISYMTAEMQSAFYYYITERNISFSLLTLDKIQEVRGLNEITYESLEFIFFKTSNKSDEHEKKSDKKERSKSDKKSPTNKSLTREDAESKINKILDKCEDMSKDDKLDMLHSIMEGVYESN